MTKRARLAVTAGMVVALAGAAAAIASFGIRIRGEERALRQDRKERLFDVDPSTALTLRVVVGGDDVSLVREGGAWRITAPVRADADDAAVNAVVERLTALTRRATVAAPGASAERLDVYGLSPPASRLEVTFAGGRVESLALGSGTGPDGALFVRPTSGEVVMVSGDARAALEKRLPDLLAPVAAPPPGAPPTGRPPAPSPPPRGG